MNTDAFTAYHAARARSVRSAKRRERLVAAGVRQIVQKMRRRGVRLNVDIGADLPPRAAGGVEPEDRP